MKKSTLWSIALIALTLVSQGMRAQDCQFTPDLFPGQAADRTSHEVSATVHVGEYGQYLTHLHSQIVNLTSTNQQIVCTTNEGGYDCVFFNGVGQADVTYTENWFVGSASGGGAEGGTTIIGGDGSVIGGDGSAGGDGGESGSSVCPSNHTIHYTVLKGTPVARFVAGRDEVITEMHVPTNTDGSYAFSAPHLELIIKELRTVNNYLQFTDLYVSQSQCTFTSSDPSIATIGRGNTVTPTGTVGHTTITATWAGSELWNGVTLSYELYVESPKNQAYLTFSPNMNYVDTVGNTLTVFPMIYPAGAEIYVQHWTSTNTSVATVDNFGNVTMLAPGTTKIYAIFDGNDDYYETRGYYDLTVIARPKQTPDIHFSAEVANVELGLPYTLPTIINNSGVNINKYYGSNPNVAQVNEATGEVTVVGEGDAQIFCETYGNDTYNPAIVSYTLHVFTYGIKVKGISVTSLNAEDVLGDGSHDVTFDLEKRFLHLNGWNIDVTALAPDIKAGVIKVEGQHVAYIVAHGINSIVGAQYGLMSEGGAIAIMGEGKDDQLNILAYDKAVYAHEFKLHQVSMYAEGTQYGLYLTHSLGISTGTYLHALGQTQAIVCNEFTKAEETDGKGIEILTPNVIFKHGGGQNLGGFMLVEGVNYSPAKDVEIGKAPVIVPADEMTTIDFTQTDPEGNETVIFNANAENSFNEETGQLEISTSLTDEQVATALETLIPGSSAWLENLPGALTFDIPAGAGDIKVQCMTVPGYELKLKIEGTASISITQAELGWAIVHYDVTEPVHVVIYLHATSGGSSAPARIATRMEDAVTAGAYIQAVIIQPANAPGYPTSIENVVNEKAGTQKVLLNGQLLIIRDGKAFNAQGAQVQ